MTSTLNTLLHENPQVHATIFQISFLVMLEGALTPLHDWIPQ